MRKLLYILPALLYLSACTEVVELDLASDEPRVVVEGLVRNTKEPLKVRLSWTVPYYNQDDMPPVKNANVTITDGITTWVLTDVEQDGYYTTPDSVTPVNGRTYTLNVSVDGHNYEASSYMNPVAPILALSYRYLEEDDGIREKGYYVTMTAQEPEAETNYYYWRMYLDDSLFDDISEVLFTDDRFANGSFILWEIPVKVTHPGLIRLEQMSITKHNFDYLTNFNTLVQANGNPFAPQPSNPVTNVRCTDDPENYAFGYFGASSVDVMEMTIP